MGEVDQAWLRLGAAESLQVNGWLGLPEMEHQVPFTFCASRLRLLCCLGYHILSHCRACSSSYPSWEQAFFILPRSRVIYWN